MAGTPHPSGAAVVPAAPGAFVAGVPVVPPHAAAMIAMAAKAAVARPR